MTAHALAARLAAGPDHEVVVAGHGRLAFVTHGGAEDGREVVTLYVDEPEPREEESLEP